MRGTSSAPNLPNLRRKARKFRRAKKVMTTERKDLGELQIRLRDIIDAQSRLARGHTGQKVH